MYGNVVVGVVGRIHHRGFVQGRSGRRRSCRGVGDSDGQSPSGDVGGFVAEEDRYDPLRGTERLVGAVRSGCGAVDGRALDGRRGRHGLSNGIHVVAGRIVDGPGHLGFASVD